jgi:hypothetical protein
LNGWVWIMIFAWQGWQIQVPEEWNPVNLQGTFEAGYALLSDIHRPRVGIRWGTPGRGFDSNRWMREAMVAEVGELAAEEAEACGEERFENAILYLEPEPPGRDVWVGFSRVSGRTFEIIHHVYPREASKIRELRGESGDVEKNSALTPTLSLSTRRRGKRGKEGRGDWAGFSDSAREGELAWAAFDLSCVTGGGWRLASQRMNAGDLSLEFGRKSERMSVRQIAVARLALKRMALEKWLEEQSRPWMKRYRRVGEVAVISMAASDGRGLEGVSCCLERRKLMIWGSGMGAMYLAVLHDAKRDRLIFVEAKDESQAGELARSVGWAGQEVLC